MKVIKDTQFRSVLGASCAKETGTRASLKGPGVLLNAQNQGLRFVEEAKNKQEAFCLAG